jgi:predicted adenine nucleotide alpha hydrolase (AANH) superfamily ATPase
VEEQKRLINSMPLKNAVEFVEGRYEPKEFYGAVKGFEEEPEGGKRCHICYEMRLREAAEYAAKGGYDYFTTTLSISPLKKSDVLNEIGERVGAECGVRHLPSDFKKKEGYKQSIELSKEYDLYRQNFCGCIFSKRQVE